MASCLPVHRQDVHMTLLLPAGHKHTHTPATASTQVHRRRHTKQKETASVAAVAATALRMPYDRSGHAQAGRQACVCAGACGGPTCAELADAAALGVRTAAHAVAAREVARALAVQAPAIHMRAQDVSRDP